MPNTTVEVTNQDTLSMLMEKSQDIVFDWGMKLLGAIAILIIGLWVIGRITKLIKKILI